MKNIFKDNFLLLVIFIIFLLKEPIYKLITNNYETYTPIKCEQLKNEYNKLLEFNNIDVIYDLEYTNTIILYKDIYDYLNEITIKGGRDKEYNNNNAVIYDNTLVGFINKVNQNSSKVTLLTNNDSKISVKINNEIGVLESKNTKLIVSNISNYSNINIGDSIYTSGLGNFEENIFIGTVKNITLENNKLEKIIEINYNLDIKDINYVTVLGVSKWFLYYFF